ncbi:MAG: hypothetical protein KDD70_18880, partial [Bdellovibrionales bacterium]|nr:hypothetical protein [Bdellovibrionales bacterium]
MRIEKLSLLPRVSLMVIFIALGALQAAAQRAAKLALDLRLPGGAAAPNLYFTLYGSGGTYLGYGKTAADGTAVLPDDFIFTYQAFTGDFPEGSYTVGVETSRSYEIPDSG